MAQRTAWVDTKYGTTLTEVLHDVPQQNNDRAVVNNLTWVVSRSTVEVFSWGTYRINYVEQMVI